MKTFAIYIGILLMLIIVFFIAVNLRICKNGRTPLYYAMFYATDHGNYALTRFLLQCGAQINIYDDENSTPLFHAASNGDINIIRLLLDHGAQVNIYDKGQATPLDCAIYSGNINIVELILRHVTDVNAQNSDGMTALYTLAMQSPPATDKDYCVNIAKLLLARGAKVNFKDDNGDAPLHDAVWSQNYSFSLFLLNHGANVNARDNGGCTPLFDCCMSGPQSKSPDLKLFNLLLSRGASTQVRDEEGSTLLHYAAISGNVDIAKKLIAMGLDCNSRDHDGKTPPMHAIDNPQVNPRIIDLLIKSGAEINAQDHSNDTLLHLAVDHRQIDVLRTLLKDGADPTIKNKAGETPLMMAYREAKQYPQSKSLYAQSISLLKKRTKQ